MKSFLPGRRHCRCGHTVKAAMLALIIAATVGMSGFFLGLRQIKTYAQSTTAPAIGPGGDRPAHGVSAFPEAPVYSDIDPENIHANGRWKNVLSTLSAPSAKDVQPVSMEHVLVVRATRRAYEGAPPVSPHPIDQMSPATCLECHGKPMVVGAVNVPQISHPPEYSNCLQCHISAVSPTRGWVVSPQTLSNGNAFAGVEGQVGSRAYPGAPPVTPHPRWMRENCLSCHGPEGSFAMRTTHPERQSCQQCHAFPADLDPRQPAFQSLFPIGGGGTPPPLPPSLQ